MEQLIFYLLAAGAIISAVFVILPTVGRNPIHSALSLIVCFFFVAGIYAALGAHLIAALQIIVYAGAIMVLFTFVVMLLNLSDAELGTTEVRWSKALGAIMVLFILGKVWSALEIAGTKTPPSLVAGGNDGFGGIEEVGHMVYTTHMVPFELVSVLLLVAAVGAVVMAKRNLDTSHDTAAPTQEIVASEGGE